MYVFSPRLLRNARLAAGLKPEQLARAVDRAGFTVREYERGRITPTVQTVCRLVDVLGIPLAGLFESEARP